MSKEVQINPLEPQEQLLVAGKIARLCEVAAEEFDPNTQVEDAAYIINALDSRINFSEKNSKAVIDFTNKGGKKLLSAETGHGNFTVDITDESKQTKVGYRDTDFRIGHYVASKFDNNQWMQMQFEHFEDRGTIGTILNRRSNITIVAYLSNLEVFNITRANYVGSKITRPWMLYHWKLTRPVKIVSQYEYMKLWVK